MRMIMSPYTALKLKVSKKNVLKDFVAMAGKSSHAPCRRGDLDNKLLCASSSGPLGVSHLLSFTKTSVGTNLVSQFWPRVNFTALISYLSVKLPATRATPPRTNVDLQGPIGMSLLFLGLYVFFAEW